MAADEFLMKLLKDINHIVQELTRIGEEPRDIFDSVLLTGKTLKNNTGEAFYTNVQRISLKGMWNYSVSSRLVEGTYLS